MLNVDDLQLLRRVVETGSVQGAARALGQSRSWLRRRITALETELGVAVLHRDRDGAWLTPAGRVLIEQGSAVVAAATALVADARRAAGEPIGILRVVEPLGLPVALRVRGFLATRGVMPEVQFHLRHVEDPLAHLDDSADLVLHGGPAPDRNAWFTRVVLKHPLRVVASEAYLRERGTPERAADLARHAVLAWRRPRVAPERWPLLGGGDVEVSPWMVSSDLLLLLGLAAEGGGLLLAPVTPVLEPIADGRLVPVLESEVGVDLPFRVSSRHAADADRRTRDALAQIRATLEGLPEE